MAKRIEEEFTCILDKLEVPLCKVYKQDEVFKPFRLEITINNPEQKEFLRLLLARTYNRTQLSDVERQYLLYLQSITEGE